MCQKSFIFAIGMLRNRAQSIAVMLAAFAVSLLLFACSGRKEMSNQVIVQNESFTLTGDSLIEDTIVTWIPNSQDRIATNLSVSRLDSIYRNSEIENLKFITGKTWRMRKARPTMMPEFTSGQPLIDALYNMSVDGIADGIDKNGNFIATHNISRLYCSIYLSLACLKPHQSMSTLKAMVDRDSIIMQREGQWPVVSDHIGWATAAWEVYKATGNRDWLTYCYRVVEKTLEINRQVLLDRETGLIHGVGYTSARPLGTRRMTWMGYNDLFACMSLGNNILTGNAYAILSDMGDELGINNSYQKDAQRIKDGINQHLWNENHGFYSSFLYGVAFPRQSPLTDNTSQAMCVLWGIADDDRAESLIANTPVSDYGVNVTYPGSTPIEPFLVNSSWATTQAMWNLAAAYTGNENALRRGLGALYRAQALYQSRGIHLQGIDTDYLGTSASNVAMVIRVLMGMSFTPEGIEFAPTVPTGMPGVKTLKGLNYRRAVLDITVKGEGNDVASITDNGKQLESAFIPCDIVGNHSIVITLQRGQHRNNKVTIHRNEVIIPITPTVVWTPDSGYIVDYQPGLAYRLSLNGKLRAIADSAFALPSTDGLTEYAVEIAGKYINGYMSRPYLDFHLTPQTAFFPDSASGHTTVTVSVAQGGDYLLDVGYRPSGTLDVREVSVNTHPMGTLVMTAVNELEINGLAYSNMITIQLLKGENAIAFKQIRLPKAFTPCEPYLVRIIKR